MKAVFTCGGTGGHINPALAVARVLLERRPDSEILFVGAEDGMEATLVPREGFRLETLQISSYMRSLKPSAIRHNVRAALSIRRALKKADRIIRDFQPDVILGTGGYASYPVVKCAAGMGIPTAVHESNMVPGLTTKMLEGSADRIMVGFEECRQHYRHPDKIVVTGTPVRGDFFDLTRSQAREKLGLTDGRPLIVSFWGSLGASHMNAHMEDFFRLEAAEGMPFHHIHGVGKSGYPAMTARLRADGLEDLAGLDVREYIYDMAPVMRAADLVICRAGASTISEITALATPAILVPSPYVTNNHQEKNARILEQHGGSVVLLEADASGEALYRAASGILRDPERQADMSRGMAELGIRDATKRLYDTVMSIRK